MKPTIPNHNLLGRAADVSGRLRSQVLCPTAGSQEKEDGAPESAAKEITLHAYPSDGRVSRCVEKDAPGRAARAGPARFRCATQSARRAIPTIPDGCRTNSTTPKALAPPVWADKPKVHSDPWVAAS